MRKILIAFIVLFLCNLAYADTEIISARQDNSKTYRVDQDTKRVETTIGLIHYKENRLDKNEQWKEIDTTITNLRVDKAPYIAEFDIDYPRFKIYHRDGGYVEEELILDNDSKLAKKGTIKDNKITYLDVLPNIDVEIIAFNHGVKQNLIIKNEAALLQSWRVKLTSSDAQSELNNSQYKFGKLIEQVIIYDDDGVEKDFTRTLVNEKMQIVMKSLVGLKYPITIDPTVMPEEEITIGTDDGREDSGAQMSLTTTTIEWKNNSPNYVKWAGFRFQTIPIPQGSTIDSASFKLYTLAVDDPNMTCYCEDVDDSTTFAGGAGNISGRTRTTASATWDLFNTGLNQWWTSPDISAPIQEVIDRAGWVTGNDLNLIIYNESSVYEYRNRMQETTTHEPKLNITYTEPASAAASTSTRTMKGFNNKGAGGTLGRFGLTNK